MNSANRALSAKKRRGVILAFTGMTVTSLVLIYWHHFRGDFAVEISEVVVSKANYLAAGYPIQDENFEKASAALNGSEPMGKWKLATVFTGAQLAHAWKNLGIETGTEKRRAAQDNKIFIGAESLHTITLISGADGQTVNVELNLAPDNSAINVTIWTGSAILLTREDGENLKLLLVKISEAKKNKIQRYFAEKLLEIRRLFN